MKSLGSFTFFSLLSSSYHHHHQQYCDLLQLNAKDVKEKLLRIETWDSVKLRMCCESIIQFGVAYFTENSNEKKEK